MSKGILPKTLMLAEDESRRARCFFVGTEHLFLAIAKQGGPQVEQGMAKHGAVLSEAVAKVRKLLHRWQPDENWSGLLQQTPRLRRISRRAAYLAERDSGKAPEAWHFLAAFFEDRRGQALRAILGLQKSPRPGGSAKPTESSTPSDSIDSSDSVAEEAGGVEMNFEPAKSILEHFGRDLTQLASEDKLSPHIGAQRELQILVRTLTRQTKPNPIIVGEPGTGKTALVEGLAQWIVAGKVPASLAGSRIVELSFNSLVAGTQYRGEFEKRIESILAELAERSEVILFLDEFHQAIGAGSVGSGGMDAANVLKPALARGELRCIAATTLREYRKYVEPDAALSRRFQPVMLNEPDEATTIEILNGLKPRLEKHHGVSIAEEAILAAIRLSGRFESERQQPDKSIDLLDDACTRVTFQSAVSEGTEDDLTVTTEHVARAVSDRTGIPVSSLTDDELERLANLEVSLGGVIQGQEEAVVAVTNALREMRLGLREDDRPQGVFLFTGPTGVGKTALAEQLAHEFFGLTEALIRIDLSEYTEPHNVSRLIGAPPGYVGHDEQGQLTRALRTRPFSLVLLDEIEKAHPRMCDVFLQVFGSGRLTDGRGEVVDCRQAMFVMTSNLGAEAYDEEGGFGFRAEVKDPESRVANRIEAVRDACRKHFRVEFLNRIDRIICFNPLGPSVMRKILDGLVEEMAANLHSRGVDLSITDAVRDALVSEAGTDRGVPPMKRLLRDRILNRIVELMVHGSLDGSLQVTADMGSQGIEVSAE